MKHLTPKEVDELRNRCRQSRLSDRQVSEKLGVTRSYVNLMFNHVYPMRRIYKTVLDAGGLKW